MNQIPSNQYLSQPQEEWVELLLLNDCEPDEELDHITRDAARILKAPIAMINLATTDHIVFKSCVGQTQGDHLEKDAAFCSRALSQEKPFMVVDATKDVIFKRSPLVTGPLMIRSYVGKSLHAPDGSRIGTLCLLDTKPRKYSFLQLQALKYLAAQAEKQLSSILLTPYSYYDLTASPAVKV